MQTFPNRHLAQQVYALGCESDILVLLQLNVANGVVYDVATYPTSDFVVGGSVNTEMFRVEALLNAVVAARSSSDEVSLQGLFTSVICVLLLG